MTFLQERVRTPRIFRRPRLDAWSIVRAKAERPYFTGQRLIDEAREIRIDAARRMMEAQCATSLWRRVCMRAMYDEIRARSPGQRKRMELALAEAMQD